MPKRRVTSTKRQREQAKRDRQQRKAERRANRHSAPKPDSEAHSDPALHDHDAH